MRRLALACLMTGLGALPALAQQTAGEHPPNPAISAKLTCRDFNTLMQPETRNTAGLAIIWLDGYTAGNAADPGLPEGWVREVAGGIGAMCHIGLNADRAVTDVIAELRRQYRAAHPLPLPATSH
jgi:hypothetical protein